MRRLLSAIYLALAIGVLAPQSLLAQKDTIKIYDEDHPIIYEDAYDLWPYCFLNDDGLPTGFNVDLVRLVCKEINVPCVIKLKPRKEVLNDMTNGRADFTLGMAAKYHTKYGYFGNSVIHLFTSSVLTPVNQPVRIREFEDLSRNKVIVHENSFTHNIMINNGWQDNAICANDMQEAVRQLSLNANGQLLWNTASLKWLMQMTHVSNLRLTPVKMDHGEYRFMANDKRLLTMLDDAYTDLNGSGKLEGLYNKWFYPEREETGIPAWLWYVVYGLGGIVFVMVIVNMLYRYQEKRVNEEGRRRNNRLGMILSVSKVYIWTYDVKTQIFTWMDRQGMPQKYYTSLEFARRYKADDYERLCEGLRQLANGEKENVSMEMIVKDDDDKTFNEEREYLIELSVLRRDRYGKPTVIIGTKDDLTDEHEKQRETRARMLKYQSVFNTAMVDMCFYDKNGMLVEMNERASKTFNLTMDQVRAKKLDISMAIEEDDFDLDKLEPMHITQVRTDLDKWESVGGGKRYYEEKIVPIRDKDHNLICIYHTGIDVTETAVTYEKVQEGIDKLKETTRKVTDYVKDINFALGKGGIRMVEYSPVNHTFTIYRALDEVHHSLTQARCITLVDDHFKRTAMHLLDNMDERTDSIYDVELKTAISIHGNPLFLHLHFMPTYDKDGNVNGYFGLCRDISDIKATEKLLELETIHAQEVEDLKNSFLRNMSYEIRTPLFSVVGFSELFEKEHDPEDEEVYITHIKDNAAFLLHLINDILFLSRLDAHMIEINKQNTDFAQSFDGMCEMGWANDKLPGVNYVVENHYEHLVVDIDESNMSRIIDQVVSNAAQHTKSGTVRARYDYVGGKLMIAVDDTGVGMSKDTLAHIYERFATGPHSGTGLGLPIVKELTEQLGGSIDISSEEGKGTTVWITMPCHATEIERKKEI